MIDLSTLWNFDDPAASEARFRDAASGMAEGSPERLDETTWVAHRWAL